MEVEAYGPSRLTILSTLLFIPVSTYTGAFLAVQLPAMLRDAYKTAKMWATFYGCMLLFFIILMNTDEETLEDVYTFFRPLNPYIDFVITVVIELNKVS